MGRLAMSIPGPVPCTPAGHRGVVGVLRDPGRGARGVHPRARLHARPPARVAPVAEAADGQRRGHGRAHRRARLAALHAARRDRRRRRRRARDPPAGAHHAGVGRDRWRRALRGSQAAARRRRARARRSRARSRPASAESGPRRSRCCSATRSKPPSARWPSRECRARTRPVPATPTVSACPLCGVPVAPASCGARRAG